MNRESICDKTGYVFRNEELLENALTHSSYIREIEEPQYKCNERLEFLGDAYLDMIISKKLYEMLPEENEGVLTKYRALIVCGASLAEIGKDLDIGSLLRMGRGEEQSGGRERESIIADAVEALIAAIILDGGYEEGEKFVLRHFGNRIEDVLSGRVQQDYKSELQEMMQANGPCSIKYRTTGETGPDHDKTFYVDVLVSNKVAGSGTGKNKKEAEQNAAKDALGK